MYKYIYIYIYSERPTWPSYVLDTRREANDSVFYPDLARRVNTRTVG